MSKKRVGGKYLVFVSHSGKDTWVAKQIAAHIHATGAKVFLDEAAIESGGDFEQQILSFLNKADEVVVLLTPWAMRRDYVLAELGVAWGRGIRIVPLLYGLEPSQLQSRPGVPVFLKKRSVIELNQVDDYFRELAGRVRAARRSSAK